MPLPARARPVRGWRVTAALALTATVVTLAPVQFAQADAMPRTPALTSASASATVEDLRKEVNRISDELAGATVSWERGQQRLGQLISLKISSEKAADQAVASVADAQQRASAYASNVYRNPYDPMLFAVLSGTFTSIGDVAWGRRTLGRTQQLKNGDLALLSRQNQQTEQLIARQEAAAHSALLLQKQLDADLATLQADAQASVAKLQAAVALVRLRAVAAATAALGAASDASRANGSGEMCTGAVPPDAINGFLPDSALCALTTAPGQRLVAGAAAAFDRMSNAFAATFGSPICVTDSYRDYATQVQVFQTKPNLAATPGRSQHGWGKAVDLCGGIQNYGTPAFVWLKANSAAYGFQHPNWAEPDGSKPEPWHWEFYG